MRIGYARISTEDQSLAGQIRQLEQAGCERIFSDTASGAAADRPGLVAALSFARSTDTLTVWKLDRLGRSTRHLIETVEGLQSRGIHLLSLTEGIDTSTPGGQLIFHIFAALAQFERDLIRERTRIGLDAARARGRKPGRKPVLDEDRVRYARLMRADGASLREVAGVLEVSPRTLRRYLQEPAG